MLLLNKENKDFYDVLRDKLHWGLHLCMIKTLYIKNFILIDEILLDFVEGFNVLLGETGAGKSIIIKAIDTVLGAKLQKKL